jgi:hypothetical protein
VLRSTYLTFDQGSCLEGCIEDINLTTPAHSQFSSYQQKLGNARFHRLKTRLYQALHSGFRQKPGKYPVLSGRNIYFPHSP